MDEEDNLLIFETVGQYELIEKCWNVEDFIFRKWTLLDAENFLSHFVEVTCRRSTKSIRVKNAIIDFDRCTYILVLSSCIFIISNNSMRFMSTPLSGTLFKTSNFIQYVVRTKISMWKSQVVLYNYKNKHILDFFFFCNSWKSFTYFSSSVFEILVKELVINLK